MSYVYRHIRQDKDQPFYIGVGSTKNYARAYEKCRRNQYWKNIVSITKYDIEILLDNLTLDEANKKEIEFISLYGRKDNGTGILANQTDGGEGGKGIVGKKLSIETIDKIRKTKSSRVYNRVVSEDTCKKISASLVGRKLSQSHIKNMTNAKKGVSLNLSEESKKKRSDNMKRIWRDRKLNNKNWMKK